MIPRLLRFLGYSAGAFIAIVFIAFLGEPLLRGAVLRNRILAAERTAAVVRLVEHSDRYDDAARIYSPYVETVFRSIDLNATQRKRLKSAFPISLDFSLLWANACIFSPHHRLEFVDPAGRSTIVEICFHCDDLRFNTAKKQFIPLRWKKSLRQFVLEVGMNDRMGERES